MNLFVVESQYPLHTAGQASSGTRFVGWLCRAEPGLLEMGRECRVG